MSCCDGSAYNGVEATMRIGRIVYSSSRTIGLSQTVLSSHHIANPAFVLTLRIPGMVIVYCISEVVVRVVERFDSALDNWYVDCGHMRLNHWLEYCHRVMYASRVRNRLSMIYCGSAECY